MEGAKAIIVLAGLLQVYPLANNIYDVYLSDQIVNKRLGYSTRQ